MAKRRVQFEYKNIEGTNKTWYPDLKKFFAKSNIIGAVHYADYGGSDGTIEDAVGEDDILDPWFLDTPEFWMRFTLEEQMNIVSSTKLTTKSFTDLMSIRVARNVREDGFIDLVQLLETNNHIATGRTIEILDL